MAYAKKKSRQSAEADRKCNNACPDNPDLLLLRDAAVDERETIAFYLRAAKELPVFADLFTEIAEDEMQHYIITMRHICMLDPIQAEEMKEAGLEELAMMPRMPAKWEKNSSKCKKEDTLSEKTLETVQYLTDALIGELLAANKYQTYMKKAEVESNKRLFCHLMNDEKEHIAEFTAALYEITGEPSLPERE